MPRRLGGRPATVRLGRAPAALNTATGFNKNIHNTITGSPALTFAGTAATGGAQGVRATIAQQSDDAQWEITPTTLPTGSNFFVFGMCDTTDDFSTSGAPGYNTTHGWAIELHMTLGVYVQWNAQGNNVQLSSQVAVLGDTYTIRYKKSSNTLTVYRTRSGVLTTFTAVTTLPLLASYNAFVAPWNAEAGSVDFSGPFVLPVTNPYG